MKRSKFRRFETVVSKVLTDSFDGIIMQYYKEEKTGGCRMKRQPLFAILLEGIYESI